MHGSIKKSQANGMLYETRLRKWQREDAYALLEICSDHAIRKQWNYACPYPYTLKKAAYCLQFFLHANPLRYQISAICHDYEVCGWIQCESFTNRCAALTYFLADGYVRSGVLREAIQLMCAECFAQGNMLSIYAKAAVDQREIQNSFLENGFTECRDAAPIYLYFLHHFTPMVNDIYPFPAPTFSSVMKTDQQTISSSER